MSDDQIEQLVLAVTSGAPFLSLKFRKFLTGFCSHDDLGSKDRVFLTLDFLVPKPTDLEKVVRKIYEARSGNLHQARTLPRSIGIGTSPQIDMLAMPLDLSAPDEVPPAVWFERVVSIAARKYILGSSVAPFAEPPDTVK